VGGDHLFDGTHLHDLRGNARLGDYTAHQFFGLLTLGATGPYTVIFIGIPYLTMN
jgi:hypothetical protein